MLGQLAGTAKQCFSETRSANETQGTFGETRGILLGRNVTLPQMLGSPSLGRNCPDAPAGRGRMIWVTPMLELRIRCVLLFLAAWATVAMLGNVCLSTETQQTSSENHAGVQSKVAALTPADYIRNDFTVEDGLLNNIIHAIIETENGMLWIGTQSGLASFDGREFKTINLQTEGAPAQGTVHSLLESSTGDLWAATDAGVVRIPKHALDQFSPTLLSFYSVGTGHTEAESLVTASIRNIRGNLSK
jgi:hypothetical protein